ncbi:MAG: diheme cytochrome c [Rhodocyclales bacterium]|nr:diheme cytochrome c [Rhodocyclales bacterium]
MKLRSRPVALGLAALAFSALVFGRAQAGGGHYYPPVADPLVKEECGSCHLAFAPAMLPAKSWQRVMNGLKNHFGDDASVDPAQAERIAAYLVANAADTGGRRYGGKLLRGVATADAPLRITELPKWVGEHRNVPDWEWRHKDVNSKANCAACHADAARGYYDE